MENKEKQAKELISQLIGLQARDAMNVTQTKLYNLNYVDSFSTTFMDAIKHMREQFPDAIRVVFERNLSGDKIFPNMNDSIHVIVGNEKISESGFSKDSHIQIPVSKLMEANMEMYLKTLTDTNCPLRYYEGWDQDTLKNAMKNSEEPTQQFLNNKELHPLIAKLSEYNFNINEAMLDMNTAFKIEVAKKLSPIFQGVYESRIKTIEDLYSLSINSYHDGFTVGAFEGQTLENVIKELKDMTRTVDGLQRCMNYELEIKEKYETTHNEPYNTDKSIFHFADKQVANDMYQMVQAKNEYIKRTMEQREEVIDFDRR